MVIPSSTKSKSSPRRVRAGRTSIVDQADAGDHRLPLRDVALEERCGVGGIALAELRLQGSKLRLGARIVEHAVDRIVEFLYHAVADAVRREHADPSRSDQGES